MRMQITNDMLSDAKKPFTIKMPAKLHNAIKAQAAVLGKQKNAFFQEIIVEGAKHIDISKKK